MKPLGFKKAMYLTGAFLLTGAIAFSTYVSFAVFEHSVDNEGTYSGKVGLRSYFQKGVGSASDPFVISRPIHFYNLTRLQNLGVFTDRFYFSLGYDPDAPDSRTEGAVVDGHTVELKFYPNDSTDATSDMIPYLDMSVESDKTLFQIGTEGSPFYGVFDGCNKDIYGLTIHGGSEDVGVFGYTYSGSEVKNVGFSNLTVEDDGYSNNLPGKNLSGGALTDTLGSLYNETSDLGSLSLVQGGTEYPLGNDYTTLTAPYNKDDKTWNVSFKATFPTINVAGLVYRVRSSSEYFASSPSAPTSVTDPMPKGEVASSIGGSTANLYFNNGSTDIETAGRERYTLQDNDTFTTGGVFNTRFSIIAEYFDEGYSYSKVLSTYLLSITNIDDTAKTYSISAAKDTSLDTGTGYAHGVNIGFLIGHCDGSATSCYVYGGAYDGKSATDATPLCSRLLTNQTASNTVAMAQESDTGLIGEYGSALSSEDTPQSQYDVAGDTGVLNFTKMYSDIVGDSSFTSTTGAGRSYYTYTPVDEDASTDGIQNKYLDVILNDSSTNVNYVSLNQNSIDFMGQTYIDENGEETRGLGVFGLATSSAITNTSSTYTAGLGDFTVTKGDEFTDFYYSTAEYHNPSGNGIEVSKWNRTSTDAKSRILSAYTLPSYSSVDIWNEDVERTFNFVFKCQLSNNGSFYQKDFFSNTTSKFLQDYLSYKLCDKYGKSISVGSRNFGVFVKNVEPGSHTATSIASFNSSLKMAPYGENKFTTSEFNTYRKDTEGNYIKKTAPAKSLNFKIESEYANVTVMASNPSTNENYVGIYDKSISLPTNLGLSKQGVYPLYAMYLPGKALSSDHFGYFNYDWSVASNNTDTHATLTSAGTSSKEMLFCHTFKVPKGEYFLGSPTTEGNIYYVCVQGQEGKGNTGNIATAYSETNSIENVEFVSRPRSIDGFSANNDSLNMSLNAKLSSNAGSIEYTGAGTGDTRSFALSVPANLVSLGIYNPKMWAFSYGNDTYAKGEKAALEIEA